MRLKIFLLAATVRAVPFLAGLVGVATYSSAQTPPAETAATSSFDAVRGDRGYGWVGQTRSETLARNGMVATSQTLAANAGLDILKAGGNAFDAAVATAAVLSVVEPESTGIGGDLFMIAWVAEEGRLIALDASGRAPMGNSAERFRDKGLETMPRRGIDSAVTPGAVDGWDAILKGYGTMEFKQALEPAVRVAEEGFAVTERIAAEWKNGEQLLQADPDAAAVYLPGGESPALYSVFRNPDMAKAFRLLQQEGRDAFYVGDIARAIVAKSQALGGTFAMEDFAKIKAHWVTPLTTNYRGFDVFQMPPPTQGVAVLEALNIVEQCGPKMGVSLPLNLKEGPRSPAFWHLLVEAKKLAYADLRTYIGDPEFVEVPAERLISKPYAASLCEKIDPKEASGIRPTAEPIGGTVYLATADKHGNLVSLIYSVYGGFGSGVAVPGYGFLLNNRGAQFSLDAASPNVLSPGKRPFYTIIPGFVMKDGKPLMAVGVMSGDQQAQGQLQVLSNMLDFGANPQAASDAARFSHSQSTNRLSLESQLFEIIGAELKAMGHDVASANGRGMGGYQAIMIDPETGVLRGASDHRKDGAAVGY